MSDQKSQNNRCFLEIGTLVNLVQRAAKRLQSAALAIRQMIRGRPFELDPKKYDYFLGKVEPPPELLQATNPKKYEKLKHNYDRSQQLKRVFESMGIHDDADGRAKLLEIFEEGAASPEIAKHVGNYGTTVTREVVRDGVKLQIKYFYPDGDMSAVPRVVTVIPKV